MNRRPATSTALRLALCVLLLAALVPTAQAAPSRAPSFSDSMVVTPSEGLTIAGVCRTYDVPEGQAMGYVGLALT